LLLAGCNAAFGLQETRTVDAQTDRDNDGVADLDDNCRELPNTLQIDSDHDGTGDECDVCPLVANPIDAADTDGDSIADMCDPRPTAAGDCMILLDRLIDPAMLSSYWTIYGDVNAVKATSGEVVLTPAMGEVVALTARDNAGVPITGTLHVQAVGHYTATLGAVGIISHAGNQTDSYRCSIDGVANTANYVYATVNTATSRAGNAGFLSSDPIGDELAFRLVEDATTFRCRADWGIATGSTFAAFSPVLPTDGAGLFAQTASWRVNAVALYRADAPCPAAIIR
jgi:hypothetical protein